MKYSRSDLMTVREMIDAVVTFNDGGMDEPTVDFNLLEAVLFIIARQLNVLERRVLTQSKRNWKKQVKTTVAITEIKVHRRVRKKRKHTTTTTTDSATEKSPFIKHQHKRKSSRSRTRSRSKKRGQYSSEDDEDSKRRGHKKHRRYREDGSRRKGRKSRDDSQVSRTSLDSRQARDQRSPVVTQNQYDKILQEIRTLQEKFGVGSNIDLHRPTSLTDPRAAMNMATRLDVAHKKLNEMITIVTKFAGAIPGFDMEAALLEKQPKDTPTSTQTPKAISTSRSSLTEPEEKLVDTDDFLWDEQNLATWSQFNADMDEIRKDVVERMSVAATKATDTAERANKLYKLNATKLSHASILNVKFARLRIVYDRFTKNANDLEAKMSTEMGACQEHVSQLQFEVDTIKERIEEALAHPALDPGAVAAAQDDFGLFQAELAVTQIKQDTLKELHELSALELERLRIKVGQVNQIKTTRDEAFDHLKEKARVDDVNSLLPSDQLYAVVCFLQEAITNTNELIHSGERMWQRCIEDYMVYLQSKGDHIHVSTLNESMRKYISIANTKVTTMLDIVGEFPVTMYEKKMDRDGNCLSCGTPADVKLSERNRELAHRLIIERRPIKFIAMEEKDTGKCYPGRPIPPSLDPRSSISDRYCGASISQTEVSLKSSMGINVVDVNPRNKDM